MILVDTSAWIEFLRETGSEACEEVQALIAEGRVATCEAVRMEVLAGARDDRDLDNLRRLLGRAVAVPTRPGDYDEAAALYNRCRRQGATVRSLVDCLIAAVAIRVGVAVLHSDRDFETIARHSRLETSARV